MTQLLIDSHMHTRFSADSDAKVHCMVEAAIEKGLQRICFTDHIDYDMEDPFDHLIFDVDLEQYFTRLNELKAQYHKQLDIGIGIEMGMQLHVTEQIHETVQRYPFDYVIASMHLVKGYDPYYEAIWKQYSEDELYRAYFEETLANVTKLDDFDALGHLDYASRYGIAYSKKYETGAVYDPVRYMDIIDEILRVLIRKDKALECNSGVLKTGALMPNPGSLVLKRYRELGGELITIGADAHKPEQIACGYPILEQILTEAGIREITYYRQRKPYQISITSAI